MSSPSVSRPDLSRSRRGPALIALALSATVLAPALPGSASTPVSLTGTPPAEAMRRVVVTGGGGLDALTGLVERSGGTVLARLPLIGGLGAELPTTAELPPSVTVVPDRSMDVAGSKGKPGRTRLVSNVRGTLGLGPVGPDGREGRRVTVAVVDTGVADVVDLAGRVRHVDVTGPDGPTHDARGDDGYGHGTFVAGLVAGNGRSGRGEFAGVAPKARILDVKVADASGSSSLIRVLRGLQVVSEDRDVDVVNLSLTSGSPLPTSIDPLAQALEVLWSRGVTVVVPAGNDGPAAGTLASPGDDPVLLTVGALDDQGTAGRGDDAVADWSARAGDGQKDPDVVASGQSVVSLLAPGSAAAGAQHASGLPAGYGRGSGTSFSTAVASGAAAALLSERRLHPDQVKALLRSTAYQPADAAPGSVAGSGGIDVAAALSAPAPQVALTRYSPPSPPGQEKRWAALANAFRTGDRVAAARAWDRLGPRQQSWAQQLWDARSPAASSWAASSWATLGWQGEGTDGTAEQWQARLWAASSWAASSWAASSWGASSWGASSWGASSWGASSWGASSWGASSWGASSWAASSWAEANWVSAWLASSWAASSWGASSWGASSWGASSWGASSWGASSWGASSWGASSWASTDWE